VSGNRSRPHRFCAKSPDSSHGATFEMARPMRAHRSPRICSAPMVRGFLPVVDRYRHLQGGWLGHQMTLEERHDAAASILR
jgi:hypothetical protein